VFPRLLPAFLELLAPLRCPGCDAIAAATMLASPFCAACAPLVEPAAQRPPGRLAAAFVFGGPVADAITRVKYARRADLARPLGALLAREALAYAGRVDRVVSMPLHPERLRARGFNQSALLAAPVARALGVPLDATALCRVRPTLEQAGLPRARRADNVRAAFRAYARVRGARVLLIDDVRTTGATAAEAGIALLDAGCEEVAMLALAQAEP
jgi:ComF family protein